MSTASWLVIAQNLAALLVMPILLSGVVVRVKARWAGRRGPPLLQLAYDLWRLWHKRSVVSSGATFVFQLAPYVALVATLGSAALLPLTGVHPIASFPFDFIWFAYVWGLSRAAMILGALDTGSSFEGMGAAREATFGTLLEPALFLVAGALALVHGEHQLWQLLAPPTGGGAAPVVWAGAVVALIIVVQVESSRMPIDDPTTHLELTMIHEVMILDHSARELAAVQWAAAIKLALGLSILASLLLGPAQSWAGVALHLAVCVALAIALGLSESLLVRLRLRAVPQYLVAAIVAGAVALLAALALSAARGAGP